MAECIYTVNCKMAPTQEQMSEIEDTLKAFADACIWINSNVDARIFAFKELDEMVSLTLLRSRQRIKLILSDYQKDRLRGSKPTSATLCKKGREYYINIQVKSEAPEPIHTNKVLGVDLGITDIAMTSEGQSFG